MPKEFRKRGKRSKKNKEDEDSAYIVYAKPEDDDKGRRAAALAGKEYVEPKQTPKPEAAGGAAYHPDRLKLLQGHEDVQNGEGSAQNAPVPSQPESIWPAVDPDTKAYFRQLEERIIELEELGIGNGQNKTVDENGEEIDEDLDDRVLLLRAALTELSGKETALATDAETSIILERLLYSMDDFARRVLADRFMGQYHELAKDRFASHVLQTLLVLGGGETVERERRGNVASAPSLGSSSNANADTDELPTLTEAIVNLTRELVGSVESVVTSQHGSYILRSLLLVLSGKPLPFNSQTGVSANTGAAGRSKKSAKWKARRAGNMKSIIPGSTNAFDAKGKAPEQRIVPLSFGDALQALTEAVDNTLSDGHPKDSKQAAQQCRLKSDDAVTTGLIQILLELEDDAGRSEESNSMMDRLLEGLISQHKQDSSLSQPARSDYIETLLRSTVSSHVLEKIITLAPQPIFDILFKVYFLGRVSRLAGHPVANFVCARVVERASKEQIEIFVDEVGDALPGCIENSRTGVVQALLDACRKYDTKQAEISKLLCNAFQTRAENEVQHLVPCGLALMSLSLYRRNPAYADPTVKPEHFVQGALLLQSWLRLKGSPVAKSILLTPIERLLSFTSEPIAARVIDVFLDEANPAVAYKDRRIFLKSLIGHYNRLADDRIGSRVADRCWQTADAFMKDKIAESLIPHEYTLQSSHFGHYFLRKVNLPLYKRDKREWRDRQARDVGGTPAELHAQAAKQELLQKQQQAQQAEKQEAQAVPAAVEEPASETAGKKRKDKKRKKDKVDEIDELFNTVKRGKHDTGAAPTAPSKQALQQRTDSQVEDTILKALRGASKETKHSS